MKNLNDELTVVGLILILLFIIYYLISYNFNIKELKKEIEEAKKVAIFLDKRLTKTETYLMDTENKLLELRNSFDDYAFIEKIKKDIDRNGLNPK